MKLILMPGEVLDVILEKLSTRDLFSVCLVSRRICQWCLPHLYREIIIYLDENNGVLPRFKSLLLVDKTWLRFTKIFGFRRDRYYLDPHSACHSDNIPPLGDGTNALKRGLFRFLQLFEENSLCEFNYDLCICALMDFFRESGLLCRHRYSLQKMNLFLSLNTREHIKKRPPIVLSSFPNLRSLSWISPHTTQEISTVLNCLVLNSEHLQSLNLRFAYTRQGPFEITSLALNKDQRPCLFPSLKNLGLESVSLYGCTRELLYALNFEGLRSLTLYDCEHTMELLKTIRANKLELSLTRLELVAGTRHFPSHKESSKGCECVGDFLSSFRGLTELYLEIDGNVDWTGLFNTINNLQSSTLERLVTPGLPIFNKEMSFSKLEFFGAFSDCRDFIQWFVMDRYLPKRLSSIKILHIRRTASPARDQHCQSIAIGSYGTTGPIAPSLITPSNTRLELPERHYPEGLEDLGVDLVTLATWVFRPNRFPNLKVLAYGDFSARGRLAGLNALLCRNEQWGDPQQGSIVRKLTKEDIFLHELVRENMEALQASPPNGRESSFHL